MLALLISSLTFAEESRPLIEGVTVHGTLRTQASYRPSFLVDFEGTSLDAGWSFDSRLRTGIDLHNPNENDAIDWKLIVNGDLFHGQFAGHPWNLNGTEHRYHPERIGVLQSDNFALRNAKIQVSFQKLGFVTGLTTSHWGLGIVSNDGAHEQEFGRADYGD